VNPISRPDASAGRRSARSRRLGAVLAALLAVAALAPPAGAQVARPLAVQYVSAGAVYVDGGRAEGLAAA